MVREDLSKGRLMLAIILLFLAVFFVFVMGSQGMLGFEGVFGLVAGYFFGTGYFEFMSWWADREHAKTLDDEEVKE